MEITEEKLFDSLFDFSFSRFLTLRILRILYALAMLFCGVATISWIVGAFETGILVGILGLLLSPFVFLVLVIWARVSLEALAAIFRIAESTAEIARLARAAPPATPQGT